MKSSGICTNSCRLGKQLSNISQKDLSGHFKFDTKSNGLNQGAHNMTHSIAGSPLWDPNSPEALSSVVSDYRTSSFREVTKRNLTNSILGLTTFSGRCLESLEQFNLPSGTSLSIVYCPWALLYNLSVWLKKNTFVCFLPDLHGRSAPPNPGQSNKFRVRLVSCLAGKGLRRFWAGKHLCNRALRIHVDLRAIHNAIMSTFISLFPLVQKGGTSLCTKFERIAIWCACVYFIHTARQVCLKSFWPLSLDFQC